MKAGPFSHLSGWIDTLMRHDRRRINRRRMLCRFGLHGWNPRWATARILDPPVCVDCAAAALRRIIR